MVVFVCFMFEHTCRLRVLYLHNAAQLFWGVWKIIQPFIDPVTRKKVLFTWREESPTLTDVYDMEV